jgi:type I restriction enzyme, S subunit
MSDNWTSTILGTICKTTQGVQIPKSEQKNKIHPDFKRYLYISDFKNAKNVKFVVNKYPDKVVSKKDLIVVNTGASAGDIFKGIDGILSNNLFKVSFDSSIINSDFLFYFVNSEIFKTYQKAMMKGTANPHMGHENFKSTPFSYPDIKEQKRIVEILDEAFAAIDKAKANVEKNLQNAKEFFESYLQNVFANKGEDWEEKSLSQSFQIKPPKSEVRNKLSENDLVSFLPMEDLNVLAHEIKSTRERILKEVVSSYTYFANDDVLLAKITPCFENGKIGIVTKLTNGVGFGSSEYVVFRSDGKIIPEYLYYFLSRNTFRKEGRTRMTGAVGHKRVSKDFIEEYTISFPKSIKEQQIIVDRFNQLSVETKKLETMYKQKMNDLEELKKSILQKAFNGELTAKEVIV